MKTPALRRKSGFTLVELLVVIAIIAVLATTAFSVGMGAIEKAKRTTALSTATSLVSSVNNFFTDYGTMPVAATSDTTYTTNTTDATGVALVNALMGLEPSTASPLYNTRGVKYFTAREGKSDKNGVIFTTGSTAIVQGLYDPWGGPFLIRLDCDYDEKIDVKTAAGSTKTLNGTRVAVWTNGADCTGLPGSSSPGKVTDDVTTWK
ncbi:MAG: type II secretion system protein [Gloeobacteraceae cyanobacterium ES-bin-144]|nr:type II secretion system protein [Verrucomicrobiales bacterium]